MVWVVVDEGVFTAPNLQVERFVSGRILVLTLL
jgi:hypothetical protein